MSAKPESHPYATQLAMRAQMSEAAEAGPIAFVDLGSFKVAALIGAATMSSDGGRRFRILGAGLAPARGVANGAVQDVSAASKSIGAALHQAEASAGVRPRAAVAALSGAQPRSLSASAEIDLPVASVKKPDLARVVISAKPPEEPENRMLLHGIAARWRLDGWPMVGDPTGRAGRKLGVQMHAVSVERKALQDLAAALRAEHMQMIGASIDSYPAGLAALSDEERLNGAALLDIGAATTSIAIFDGDRLVYADSVPQGGDRVTAQIAHSFSLPFEDAERLKQLEGSAAATTRPGAIEAQRSGAPPLHLDRAALTATIRPRVLETLEAARDRLAQAGFLSAAARPILVTGGGAQLGGFFAAAEEVFGERIQLAAPLAPDGLAALGGKGVWAASVGLARLTAGAPETPFGEGLPKRKPDGASGFIRWLFESW